MAASTPRKKPFDAPGHVIGVDQWTLHCLYKLSNYGDRIASGELVALYEEPSKFRANDERTVQVYYGRDDDKLTLVRLQWFENKAGEILRSGLKEPKHLCFNGFDYHLHGGNSGWNKVRRDPTSFWRTENVTVIAIKKRYGDWRRFKCAKFGPVEARWRCRWFTSRLYRACRDALDGAMRHWNRLWKAWRPLRSYVRRLFSQPPTRVLALA